MSSRNAISFLFVAYTVVAGAAAGLAAAPPPIEREFRAAWIATVANIDWPSKQGLPPDEQRAELIALLDLAAALQMNAIVFQVRPACDALYASQLEPWSEFLTGQMGRAPKDGYDPLEFAVAEAHRRGLELHAWFNPYRASHSSSKGPIAATHISKTHPEIVREYGKQLWLDPGEPAAEEHSRRVILDVVERYDIDAVHFDDYFYPYPVVDKDGNETPFPDDQSWEKYQTLTPVAERLSRDDFRRENVNRLLRSLASEIKQLKRWVKFGVSPFGIYRPGHPDTIKGFDAYAKLYADSRLWLEEGIVDYMSPQLYWPIDQKPQSFPVLLEWWQEHNPQQRPIWPGLFTSKVLTDGKGWPVSEISEQIEITRDNLDKSGHIHFSIKAIAQNRSGLKDLLQSEVYAQPVLPPIVESCDVPSLEFPELSIRVTRKGSRTKLRFDPGNQQVPWLWAVQAFQDGQWSTQIVPGSLETYSIDGHVTDSSHIVVHAVDRLGRIATTTRPTSMEGLSASSREK